MFSLPEIPIEITRLVFSTAKAWKSKIFLERNSPSSKIIEERVETLW
jgi:hypothetical protein